MAMASMIRIGAHVSSNNKQLITINKNLNRSHTSSKHNYFHTQQKINYNYSVNMIMASSVASDTNVAVVDRAHDAAEMMPRPVTMSFGRSLWAEVIFDGDSQRDYQKVREDCYYAGAVESLKESVRRMLIEEEEYNTSGDKLVLIDTLERLGIAYHFEHEIADQMQQIYFKLGPEDREFSDLFTTALYFRMFRQHGYNVSCRVFDKFKDVKTNKFKASLRCDVEGLLSLYEASFLRFREEIELKEARDLSVRHLNECKLRLEDSSYLKDKVNRALVQPLHWALPKLEARRYMSIYEKKESMDPKILRLAKLDFNFMQSLYKKEMQELHEWWYGFDLVSKLPYARDNVVPCYFWASALSHEPKYSRSRVAAAKVFATGTLFNDTYDNYATLEESEALTNIMQRVHITYHTRAKFLGHNTEKTARVCYKNGTKKIKRKMAPILFRSGGGSIDAGKIPNYMKIVYDVFLQTLDSFEREATDVGRFYGFAYLEETFRRAASVFHKKATWYKGGERPRFEDHVGSMGITSGLHQMLAAFYVHDECVSKETFDWLMSEPESVERAALYCRYLNDISSYERERESGHYPTSVDCYMEENNVTMQETKEKFSELAEECWMALNEELMEEITCKDNLKPPINFCRVIFALYGYGLDLFSRPEDGLVACINALLLDPLL